MKRKEFEEKSIKRRRKRNKYLPSSLSLMVITDVESLLLASARHIVTFHIACFTFMTPIGNLGILLIAEGMWDIQLLHIQKCSLFSLRDALWYTISDFFVSLLHLFPPIQLDKAQINNSKGEGTLSHISPTWLVAISVILSWIRSEKGKYFSLLLCTVS